MVQKIIDSLSVIDRKEIQGIATDINDAFMKASEHAGKAVTEYLRAGELLTQARTFYAGDLEFGRWRAENTTVSQGWARKLMVAFAAYGTDTPKGLPISTLAELAPASADLKDRVEAAAVDPEVKTPSVRDVRAAVKEERKEAAPIVDEPMPQAMKDRLADETQSLEAMAQLRIDAEYEDRVTDWEASDKEVEDAFILLGLPPFFDGWPNRKTLILLAKALSRNGSGEAANAALDVINTQ